MHGSSAAPPARSLARGEAGAARGAAPALKKTGLVGPPRRRGVPPPGSENRTGGARDRPQCPTRPATRRHSPRACTWLCQRAARRRRFRCFLVWLLRQSPCWRATRAACPSRRAPEPTSGPKVPLGRRLGARRGRDGWGSGAERGAPARNPAGAAKRSRSGAKHASSSSSTTSAPTCSVAAAAGMARGGSARQARAPR